MVQCVLVLSWGCSEKGLPSPAVSSTTVLLCSRTFWVYDDFQQTRMSGTLLEIFRIHRGRISDHLVSHSSKLFSVSYQQCGDSLKSVRKKFLLVVPGVIPLCHLMFGSPVIVSLSS